jgi:putative transposase
MEGHMDRDELKRLTKEEISRRIREGVKAVIEQVLEEEMTEHLAAGYRERTPSRRGERNGSYTRDLITPAGRIAQLRVPRDREETFLTGVFERYKRMTGEVAVSYAASTCTGNRGLKSRLSLPAMSLRRHW